ncbi:MAG: HAD family hydrolase [Candidatus Peribacteraceae bacterium]|nr:HAD family hydrolase [Candidatus Peribacteraceae bacterium]
MHFDVPGVGPIDIDTILLDLNGTLRDKKKFLVPGVNTRIARLRELVRLILLSGDTRGDAAVLAEELGIEFIRTPTAADKGAIVDRLGAEHCAGIGNGLIDLTMVERARIGIAVLQGEGAHMKTLHAADIVVTSVNDALDFFLDEKSLIATLRA